MRLDRQRIVEWLASVADALEGRFLVAGGAAAAAWFSPARTTEDIDIVAIDGGNTERLALLDHAAAAGLPIEAVSSTIDYFLRAIPDWREHLVEMHRGPRATVLRPDATLFLHLKLRRLSEADLGDCVALLGTDERVDTERLLAALAALPTTDDDALAERRDSLRASFRSR